MCFCVTPLLHLHVAPSYRKDFNVLYVKEHVHQEVSGIFIGCW